jgi:hypothetical protein
VEKTNVEFENLKLAMSNKFELFEEKLKIVFENLEKK